MGSNRGSKYVESSSQGPNPGLVSLYCSSYTQDDRIHNTHIVIPICSHDCFSFVHDNKKIKSAAERRRREEGWNDLGLDQLDNSQQQQATWSSIGNWNNANPPNGADNAGAGNNN